MVVDTFDTANIMIPWLVCDIQVELKLRKVATAWKRCCDVKFCSHFLKGWLLVLCMWSDLPDLPDLPHLFFIKNLC